jgi:hypothetical protein
MVLGALSLPSDLDVPRRRHVYVRDPVRYATSAAEPEAEDLFLLSDRTGIETRTGSVVLSQGSPHTPRLHTDWSARGRVLSLPIFIEQL